MTAGVHEDRWDVSAGTASDARIRRVGEVPVDEPCPTVVGPADGLADVGVGRAGRVASPTAVA